MKKLNDLKIVKKINEGVSNETYLTKDNLIYRYKSPNPDPFNKVKNEKLVIEKIKGLPFSEEVTYFDRKGNKVSKFIENTRFFNSTPNDIKKAAFFISSFHSLSIPNLGKFNPFKRLTLYRENLDAIIDEKDYKTIIKKTKKLYKTYPLVVSHNDLVHTNILLKDEQIYVLDYEFASLNIELFDIASLLSENSIASEKNIEYILSLFDNKYPKDELLLMINFQDLLWHYWALFHYEKSAKVEYLRIADTKRINLLRRLENG